MIALVVVTLMSGCSDGDGPADSSDRPLFVTTIPPFAMVLGPIVDGRATVKPLLKAGESPHTYAPVPSDIRAATNAAALIYGAEHLDGWSTDLSVRRRIGLVSLLPDSSRRSFAASDKREVIDPHFWPDPHAVRAMLPALVDSLCVLDASGCGTYRTNADAFATELRALEAELEDMMAPVRHERVVLAQPFFRYFLARYGPTLVGVVEPSPGREASPRQVERLAATMRETGARVLLTQRQLSPRSAETVAEAANGQIVTLDPIGGAEEVDTYRELILWNARRLRSALQPQRGSQ